MRKLNLLILIGLLSISWIQSSAQTGDSLKCYNKEELKKISSKLIRANESDSLLKVKSLRLTLLDSVIFKQGVIITQKDSVIVNYVTIKTIQDANIKNLSADLKKERTNHIITKLSWLATSILLILLNFV